MEAGVIGSGEGAQYQCERLQGTHQVSVDEKKERVMTYEEIKDLQCLPRSIVLGHVPMSRPRDDDTEDV